MTEVFEEGEGKPTLPPGRPSLVVLEMKMCKFVPFQGEDKLK
jgi:hypothetical protein